MIENEGTGDWKFEPMEPLAPGDHVFTARTIDDADNVSDFSLPVTVHVAKVTITSPKPAFVSDSVQEIAFAASKSDGLTYECRHVFPEGSDEIESCDSPWPRRDLIEGTHTMSVVAVGRRRARRRDAGRQLDVHRRPDGPGAGHRVGRRVWRVGDVRDQRRAGRPLRVPPDRPRPRRRLRGVRRRLSRTPVSPPAITRSPFARTTAPGTSPTPRHGRSRSPRCCPRRRRLPRRLRRPRPPHRPRRGRSSGRRSWSGRSAARSA